MAWWSWMIIGTLLLGAELLGVDAAFYLVFIGFAAIVVGLIELAGAGLDIWLQWIIFAALAVTMMVLFRKQLYAKLRGAGPGYQVGPAGEIVTLDEPLEPHQSGRLKYRGTDWTVVNEGSRTIDAGQRARIGSVDGLKLIIEPLEE